MNKIRWGVLGAAKIARNFVIPAIQASRNGHVAALAFNDATRLQETCARFDIGRAFGNYDALLESDAVDAIYIPTPNSSHVDWSLKAIRAGKHVLCEKPIAMHAAEIDQLIAARDSHGRVVAEAFMVAHHPQWHLVRDILAAGRIGELRLVEGCFTYFNTDPSSIKNRLELGGGGIRDIGVYPVVTTRIATGKEPQRIEASVERDPRFGTDKLAIVRARFDDFRLTFYCGTQAARRQQMLFHGERGWIRMDAPFNPDVYGPATVQIRADDSHVIEEHRFAKVDQYQSMVENFSDAVGGSSALRFDLENSRRNQSVIDAVFAAADGPGFTLLQ